MSSIQSFTTTPRTTSDFGGEVLWILHAPCGCRAGWIATAIPGAGELLDEASVWDVAPPVGKVRTDRMRSEGFRWMIEPSERAKSGMVDCSHTPLYGSSVYSAPIGYTWATRGRTATVEHLVPSIEVDELTYMTPYRLEAKLTPLCSTEPTTPWWLVTEADPCPECEQAASGIARSDSSPPRAGA